MGLGKAKVWFTLSYNELARDNILFNYQVAPLPKLASGEFTKWFNEKAKRGGKWTLDNSYILQETLNNV